MLIVYLKIMRNKTRKLLLIGSLFIILLLLSYFDGALGRVVRQDNRNVVFSIKEQQVLAKEQDQSIVIVATVDGEIKEGIAKHLRRAISYAENRKADYLVIKLHTPGGLLTATQSIVHDIQETDIPLIVFVYQEAGWGYSAGTFILMAADIAVMHPYANIGAAQPAFMMRVQKEQFLLKENEEDFEEQPKKEQLKIIEAMAEWIESIAEANDRNPEVAGRFVRNNLVLNGREALEYGVIDFIAYDLDELFEILEIQDPYIISINLTLAEKLFNFFSHPFVIPLLLIFGFFGIVSAIQTREIEIGAVALIPLFIGIWGLGIIEFNILSLFLILLGLVLLTVELLTFAGFGALGIGGIIAVLVGMIGFEAEPLLQPSLALNIVALITVIIICFIFIIISRAIIKALRTKPHTGVESLVGKIVEVTKELNPEGQIIDKGEIWIAESINKEIISKKTKVKIEKVQGNKVYVSLLDDK